MVVVYCRGGWVSTGVVVYSWIMDIMMKAIPVM